MESGINNDDLQAKNAIFEIESYVDSIEKNDLLHEERYFDKRNERVDFIGFQLLDQIDALLGKSTHPDKLLQLKLRAEKIRTELEEIDKDLLQGIRLNIQSGYYKGSAFKKLLAEYFDFNTDHKEYLEGACYDNLDVFINGLLAVKKIPEPTKALEPEMVYYQKTPARIVFELVEKIKFTKDDVFFDIGGGLGQTAILVNLLSGIAVRGIEFEPVFCKYANDCSRELNLSKVTFFNIDARDAGYSDGTVFFMFTPFTGEMLKSVLEKLRAESLKRKIKVVTYGPCTTYIMLEGWLDCTEWKDENIYQLGIFCSH